MEAERLEAIATNSGAKRPVHEVASPQKSAGRVRENETQLVRLSGEKLRTQNPNRLAGEIHPPMPRPCLCRYELALVGTGFDEQGATGEVKGGVTERKQLTRRRPVRHAKRTRLPYGSDGLGGK